MKKYIAVIAFTLVATSALAMNAPQPKPGVLTLRKMHDAAVTLLDIMNSDGVMQKQMNLALDEQMKTMSSMPCADRVSPQLRNILGDALNYDSMKGDLANVYANTFTLAELNWMIDFYKTPLGVKMLKAQPAIYETTTRLTTERMKAAEPKIAALFASNLNTTECQAKR